MEMIERARELAAEMRPAMVDFAQRGIRCPSLPGEERAFAQLVLKELQTLGYEATCVDDWGNVMGMVRGNAEGPTIMYNAHLDHVDIGDPSEWGGYDPYGGEIDVAEVENQTGDGMEMAEVIHGRAASDTKGGMACQIYSGAILIRLMKEGYTIKGNYLFTACVLEEPAEQIGMIGLYEHTLQQKGYTVDGVVSCESTSLKLYLGHRGRVELDVEICGVTAHASAPWLGLNAVNKATKFVDAVEARYAGDIRVDPKLGKSSIALTIISCSPGAMCIVPDRYNIAFDRRLVPTETPEDAVREIQEIIDRLEAEDPDFHASVKISAVPRKTYTGKTVTIPNIKQGWRIEEEHPFVKACAAALASLGEPVGYGYWNFGTDLALLCGKHKIPAVGYSPMQELYCHRSVDRIRTDFMDRAVIGNVAVFQHLAKLPKQEFRLP